MINKSKIKIMALTALCISLMAFSAFAGGANIITSEQAVNTALAQVQGKLLEVELEGRRNSLEYEVKILDPKGVYHRLNIDAQTGAVSSQWTDSMRQEKIAVLNKAKLSHSEAIKIAMDKLPGSICIESSLEAKGGRAVYEITLVDPTGLEFDAYVNAVDGTLISLRQDEIIINQPKISKAEAEKIALASIKGTVLYTILDEDDGRTYYKVKLISNDARLFESKIDADNGKILRTKMDD